MSKFTYFYEFLEGFCAGAVTSRLCAEQGLPTCGNITGKGWGATPNQAKKMAKLNSKSSGNVNLEWVYEASKLFKNGKLIEKT